MFEKNEEIYVMALAGVLLVLFLVIVFVVSVVKYSRRQARNEKERMQMEKQFGQELLKAQLETQEETFQQINLELHDNIAQLLGSARMYIGLTTRSLSSVPQSLQSADDMLEKAIQELRMLSKSLNREWLNQFSVLKNVQAEVERLNSASEISVSMQTDVESLPLSPDAQLMLFRIIQEALQNSIKHASPRHIGIGFKQHHQKITVTITDDGVGFLPNEQKPSGVGRLNMKHRIALLNGTVQWQSAAERGTSVLISLPAKKDQ